MDKPTQREFIEGFDRLRLLLDRLDHSRPRSIVQTKIDEAEMWLTRVQDVKRTE